MHAALAAYGVHGHDIGVMQLGGGLGFVVETLQLLGVEGGGEGQHLQGHAASQRQLHRFIDDAHAAATDLAQDGKIAEGIDR